MKVNPSLTAAITAAALLVGAGFAYAQSTAPSLAAEPMAPGSTLQQAPSTDSSTMQAQPPSSSGTSLDNSATQSGMATTMPEPRADRN
jgi:hypothetical protein